MAVKCSYIQVNGTERAIKKDPKTDPGKKSAMGLLRVEKIGSDYILFENQTMEEETKGELRVIYQNGVEFNTISLATIRQTLLES
jgi:nicotinamide phosphoribosyltransferase